MAGGETSTGLAERQQPRPVRHEVISLQGSPRIGLQPWRLFGESPEIWLPDWGGIYVLGLDLHRFDRPVRWSQGQSGVFGILGAGRDCHDF